MWFARGCKACCLILCVLFCGCASSDSDRAVCQIRMPECQGSGTLIAVHGNVGLVLSCRHVCERIGNTCQLNGSALKVK